MQGGYTDKILQVDLGTGDIHQESPGDDLYGDYLGGYGIGARLLYDRMPAGVDALGPDNILGFLTGPLTGTPAPTGARFSVVGKSPLTQTWGDANCGGNFGPYLKFAGYDGVLFNGVAASPVYLFIDGGQAQLLPADDLWGLDATQVDRHFHQLYGRKVSVACIGPAGEKLSLISCIINDQGRAAGRCGLGAVMGSKKLKAIVVRVDQEVLPLADPEAMEQSRREYLDELNAGSFAERWRKYGTTGGVARSAMTGDGPTKNWGGTGEVDFPNAAAISDDALVPDRKRNYACWHCPLSCGALIKPSSGRYSWEEGAHRPEYETLTTFGTMTLNDNKDSINKANDICNRAGLDTISAGCVVAFAIECFENGLLTMEDTDGLELRWGNHEAIVAVTEKLARREGFGDVIADGVAQAADRIGGRAHEFAVHIGGQELGMHDPKLRSPALMRYVVDAAPGRHMQGYGATANRTHVINMAGLCSFGFLGGLDAGGYVSRWMAATTGLERSWDELEVTGERASNLRQAFNLREGLTPADFPVHGRISGHPPLEAGPLAGKQIDVQEELTKEFALRDWDLETGKPSRAKLESLGLHDIARDLWD